MKAEPTKADFDNIHSHYAASLQQLDDARAEWRLFLSKTETLKKAMQAAQSEAEAANAEWRERFQESGGVITPEVKRLRKASREAADLVEEYGPLYDEALHGLDVRKLALAEAAGEAMSVHRRHANAQRDAEIAQLVESCGPAIQKARALFHGQFDNPRIDRLSPEYTNDPAELDRQFFHRLASLLGPCDQQEGAASSLGPIDMTDVDQDLARSPARQMALRTRLRARRPEA